MLAVIAIVVVVLAIWGHMTRTREPAPPPPIEDAAAPYREGLHAAVRMQRVAQDLEQQIYAEAAQHINADAERSGVQAGGEQP